MSYVYVKDQELPAMTFAWTDNTGALIDFSSGWTFTAKVATTAAPATIVLTKSSGITGAATDPNVTVDWATTDFSGLTASTDGINYVVWLYARRTSDSKDRVFRPNNLPQFQLLTAPV